MLLDEAEEPMDFSRGSERLQEYTTGRMEAAAGRQEEKLGDPFAAAQNSEMQTAVASTSQCLTD